MRPAAAPRSCSASSRHRIPARHPLGRRGGRRRHPRAAGGPGLWEPGGDPHARCACVWKPPASERHCVPPPRPPPGPPGLSSPPSPPLPPPTPPYQAGCWRWALTGFRGIRLPAAFVTSIPRAPKSAGSGASRGGSTRCVRATQDLGGGRDPGWQCFVRCLRPPFPPPCPLGGGPELGVARRRPREAVSKVRLLRKHRDVYLGMSSFRAACIFRHPLTQLHAPLCFPFYHCADSRLRGWLLPQNHVAAGKNLFCFVRHCCVGRASFRRGHF